MTRIRRGLFMAPVLAPALAPMLAPVLSATLLSLPGAATAAPSGWSQADSLVLAQAESDDETRKPPREHRRSPQQDPRERQPDRQRPPEDMGRPDMGRPDMGRPDAGRPAHGQQPRDMQRQKGQDMREMPQRPRPPEGFERPDQPRPRDLERQRGQDMREVPHRPRPPEGFERPDQPRPRDFQRQQGQDMREVPPHGQVQPPAPRFGGPAAADTPARPQPTPPDRRQQPPGDGQPGQIQPGQVQPTRPQPPALQRPAGPDVAPDGRQGLDRARPAAPGTTAQPPAPPYGGAAFGGQRPGGEAATIDDLRRERRERRDDGGRRLVIEEPDNRVIIRDGSRVIIQHDETSRLRRDARDVRVERRGAETVTVVERPDGVRIVTVMDASGRLVRRTRRLTDGREVVLIDNRLREPGRFGSGFVVDLPPPALRIPRERYIVEADEASEEDLIETFEAPPIERLPRRYTLDEIRQSPRLRERMRSVNVDTINFDFGSWQIAPDQVDRLAVLARAIRTVVNRNPNEVFLIEGHTDAVGADVDNLSLSDRRAESVAVALSERFGIPAENLTTQGYGEQFLKVNTQAAERANRRVTVRRITPLLSSGGN